jgi:hypothetical protein
MGYTHYWAYRPDHPAYRQEWPAIVDAAGRIAAHLRQAGITIAGPAGHGQPRLDLASGVSFNGDAAAELDCEPFTLAPPQETTDASQAVSTFCKTNRLPYDVAVAGLLLFCQQLVPQVFTIASDGEWDREWANGAGGWQPDPADTELSARGLVAELFDIRPQASPLSEDLPGDW